jgi:hypothetical protein
MAVVVVDCVLMWFEDQEAVATESATLDLARQFAALRVTAATEAGRRLSRPLQNLCVQYRELQVTRMQWQFAWALSEGRGYLTQLRAVLLAYEPGRAVTMPPDFPDAAPRLGEIAVDMHAVEGALIDFGVGDRDRRRLIAFAHHLL